ncbi:MAG TPA: hypothetical protein VN205_07885 [Thermomonas sp.]|nr:hypothetical protein [Thermomonas sp.]
MKNGILIGLAVAVMGTASAQASGINGINGGMPNRISMNVTVPKQTQGATFGEKVNAGLHAAGSAVAQGSTLTLVIECGQAACAIAFPDGNGYRADFARQRFEVLKSSKSAALRKGEAGGAALLGAALPGGAVISAAVSSVGNLAGSGGGAAAASYARTGRVGEGGKEGLATASTAPGVIDVLDPLTDGEYMLTLVVDKATSGLKDTLKTQVRAAVTQQVRIEVGFSVEAGVLKTKHDTAKNSVGNIR